MKNKGIDHNGFNQKMREKEKILMYPTFKNDGMRIFTHRDVSEKEIEKVI